MSQINNLAKFNDTLLTSVDGLTVLATDPYRTPKRTLSYDGLARTDKGKVSGAFYTDRNITVRVGITQKTRQAVEVSLDTLLQLLQGVEKELVLSQSATVRKYYCTLSDVVTRAAGGSYLELDLVFKCSDMFGYDTNYTTALNLSGITAGSRADQLEFKGSAPWQTPYITITYSAVTGGTSKTVNVGNAATGQMVSITRTWVAGDRLEIDSFNKTVKVNGVEVAYSGAIPEFAPQLGNWSYSDNLTTRTFSATITYYKRWV